MSVSSTVPRSSLTQPGEPGEGDELPRAAERVLEVRAGRAPRPRTRSRTRRAGGARAGRWRAAGRARRRGGGRGWGACAHRTCARAGAARPAPGRGPAARCRRGGGRPRTPASTRPGPAGRSRRHRRARAPRTPRAAPPRTRQRGAARPRRRPCLRSTSKWSSRSEANISRARSQATSISAGPQAAVRRADRLGREGSGASGGVLSGAERCTHYIDAARRAAHGVRTPSRATRRGTPCLPGAC